MIRDRILAAFMFFTRLPFWRIKTVDTECFKHVVDYWPFTGWLTGGAMAIVYGVGIQIFPVTVTVLLALAVRLLLTGALHEDGLADFFDGFGGGTTPARTLAIMKDSHIGTYGVLGLIMYVALLVNLLTALPSVWIPLCLITADVYSKICSSFLILQLPYARTAEQAKSGVVYTTWNRRATAYHVLRCLTALLPVIACWAYVRPHLPFWIWLIPPFCEYLLMRLIKHRLQGYTGDCCGAMFLLCELSFYLVCMAATH